MPAPRFRLTHEITGALLAGAALGALTAAVLNAFPSGLLLCIALATGVGCALPWGLVLLARGLARSEPEGGPLGHLLRGAVLTTGVWITLDLLGYAALRHLAVVAALIVDEGPWLTVAGIAALILVAWGSTWRGLRLARHLPETHRPWPWVMGSAIALVFACAVAGWRGEAPEHTTTAEAPGEPGAPTLLVVGLDAVGAELFERYGHRMPNLSAFADDAARGLLVPEPPYLSPAIWTSIATGKPAREHGVSNYELWADRPGVGTIPIDRFYTNPVAAAGILPAIVAWRAGWLAVLPSTRLHRDGEPFWQDWDHAGVVCWPATWPADDSAAFTVSDRWPPDRTETLFQYREDLPNQVHPPSAAQDLAPLRRSPSEPPDPEVLAMAPLTERERDAFHAALEDDLAAPKDQPFSNLHYAWLNDRSCLAAADWMLTKVHPRLAVVYLMGPDLTGHAFLPDERGRVAGFEGDDATRLAAVYPAYLERLDQDLATLLAAAGPETTTVLLSDHGMQHQGTGLFSVWHQGDGLVLVRGPGHSPGQDLGRHPAHYWHRLLAAP